MKCCNKNNEKKQSNNSTEKSTSIRQGIFYALIPHLGCIGFIIGSILGATILMQLFKPLLMNRYFFYYLVGISIGFATLSTYLYLKKNNQTSLSGIKERWKYITGMYGSTIGINLILFLLIFPLLANVNANPLTGNAVGNEKQMTLYVNIPCSGHALLISDELKTINGVREVKYEFPYDFVVKYDTGLTNQEKILSLEVFKEYPAIVQSSQIIDLKDNENQKSVETCSTNTEELCSINV